MNIHITPSVAAQARDVSSLTTEEVACLIEESAIPTVIGIFPTGYPEEPWRAHVLRGPPVDDLSEQEGAASFRFESSTASFRVKQALRRRERDKSRRPARILSAMRSCVTPTGGHRGGNHE
jgi:hypothetical protein